MSGAGEQLDVAATAGSQSVLELEEPTSLVPHLRAHTLAAHDGESSSIIRLASMLLKQLSAATTDVRSSVLPAVMAVNSLDAPSSLLEVKAEDKEILLAQPASASLKVRKNARRSPKKATDSASPSKTRPNDVARTSALPLTEAEKNEEALSNAASRERPTTKLGMEQQMYVTVVL